MEPSSLFTSIDIALDKLLYQREQSTTPSERIELGITMRWLCAVRTFCFCSTRLAYNVELRAEGNNDNAVTSLRSQKKKMKEKKSRMRKSLRSLLVRVEDVICRILSNRSQSVPSDFQYEMGSCDEEMGEWYAGWSVFVKKYSTYPVANQMKAIEDSVFENLKDFPDSGVGYDLQFKVELRQMEALKRKITVMRKITCFGTLLCTENQDFRCPLTLVEPLAISAAHLARIFSNIEGPMDLPNDLTRSMLSALLLKFNPLLHEKYTMTLPRLNHSREICDPTLDLNDYPFIMKMERCIVYLSSTLLEILQLDTSVYMKMLVLYERLRWLRTLLKRQPDRFNNDKIRNLTAAIVGDAGVRIFSFYQKDSVTDHWLQCILEDSEVIWAEVLEEKVMETSTFNFPMINILGFLDFLLEDYLMEVDSSNIDSNTLSCVPKIREHLVFLKSFTEKLAELKKQQENLHQDVWNLVVQMAFKIELLIDQLVLGDVHDSFSVSLQSITEYIMILKADYLNIFNDEERQESFKVQKINWPTADKVRSISSSQVADEVVGFESEKGLIVNRLMGGFKKLQVVAIVGMPGLGKTTLATKVYRDSSVTHHFPVKAWCSISQVFNRKKVLLELLNQIQPGKSDSTWSEDDLSQLLWRSLRRRRYLIFIDDIWETKAFDLLKGSLPEDSNRSRILLTSRHTDVVPEALLDGKPIRLPHLTEDESLVLLQRKLFPGQKAWPSELHEIGMEIAEYCKGLPLTVVILAGLLKTTAQEGWKDVLKTIRSSIISEIKDQCDSTIELSYKHLLDHLKPCFLWFGAFPEDHKFSVKRMIWLWISEGLVRKTDSKSLEEVARDYMNHLIARSLVMNVEGRSVGGVKTCRIHDLLHDFCLRKANEEFSLHVLKVDSTEPKELFSGEFETLSLDETEILSSVKLRNLRRLCIYSKPEHMWWKVFCPRLRSLIFFRPTEWGQKLDLSYIFRMFKLLRVLGIDEVELTGFPSEIGFLVQLRYLAIQVGDFVGPAIGNLSNLETLIILGPRIGVVIMPDTVWNLRKLRHLHLNSNPYCCIEMPIDVHDSSCNLLELQTLSTLCVRDLSIMEKQLRKFPNIRQMKFKFGMGTDDFVYDSSKVMDLSFLSQLESLSLSGTRYGAKLLEVIFPDSIKKLTLWVIDVPWLKIASIGKLPNLEVLKMNLRSHTWHVEEGDYSKLKYLELHSLFLVKWTAASDDLFPNLRKLVLDSCFGLKKIPECLENVATLEMIEVIACPPHVVRVVKRVEEFQKEMGNSVLQFHEYSMF